LLIPPPLPTIIITTTTTTTSIGGKIDYRRFIEYIRSKQPTTVNVETKFKRMLAKAELGK